MINKNVAYQFHISYLLSNTLFNQESTHFDFSLAHQSHFSCTVDLIELYAELKLMWNNYAFRVHYVFNLQKRKKLKEKNSKEKNLRKIEKYK